MRFLFVYLVVFTIVGCNTANTGSSSLMDDDSLASRRTTLKDLLQKATCLSSDGTKLEIERSKDELPFPSFHISLYQPNITTVIVRNAKLSDRVPGVVGFESSSATAIRWAGIEESADGQTAGGHFRQYDTDGNITQVIGLHDSCYITQTAERGVQNSPRSIVSAFCRDNSGLKTLSLERSENELPYPTYHLRQTYEDRLVTKIGDMPVAANSTNHFMIQKTALLDHRENIEVSAGITWNTSGEASGFYMEAANGGASPLPGTNYENCHVVEIRLPPAPN